MRRIEETADVITLVLEPTDGDPLPKIAPGQYVSVFVDLPGGDRQPRQYTVSSTAVRTRLQITVRRVRGANGAPDGRVSSHLHDQVEIGDVLDVSGPAGDFVLTPTESPILLASAGAGITTVLPIVEQIARTQPQRTVIVAHADRRAQDHALRETVLHLGREIDDFTSYAWYETVDDGDTRSRQGIHGLDRHPAPARHSGLHLRSAAVHETRQVDIAVTRRAGGPNPLRSLRTRPVGRPNLVRFGDLTEILDSARAQPSRSAG